ncbi:activin receptor type-2B-like [Ylistrum balloti]|uniref:activin receptor type-2B-like n=1 Tax=Ylistrum balloti TaxID=509963 RepID=UPI002905DBB2|nr:activin receptor type-2B-like [Ylistrum balloti]
MNSHNLFPRLCSIFCVFSLALSFQISAGSTIEGKTSEVPKLRCVVYKDRCNSSIEHCETVQECDAEMPHCFSAWRNTSNGIDIMRQGCWTDKDMCDQENCIQSQEITSVLFCCCNKPLCNQDITPMNYPPTTTPSTIGTDTSSTKTNPPEDKLLKTLLYSIVPIIVLVIIIIGVFFMWRFYFKENRYMQHHQLSTGDPELDLPPSPHPLRPVQLEEVRAHGRFGVVWKGVMSDQVVAVKIMPFKERSSWMTEQEIYKLPHMKHENLLAFIGAEKRDENLWLISVFHEYGSLSDYLKGNTITWSELCKIAETMTNGLAYLHDEIPPARGMEGKPSIAHRDFKSKNVLLKDDLTTCIADLGLAIKFEPGKSPGETHGLVGTRRYMAPEVLEGAISFNRDAFLRIDMYACGLVMWELLSRCSGSDGPVEDYQLPYEEEIGSHPTLEDMQELVVMKKIRPTIKDYWMRHVGLEALIPTIEECWDQDAEARVSADCVHERLLQIGRTLNVSNSTNHLLCPNQETTHYQISTISS